MKEKNSVIPINQDEISHYLKDIRKIKVMTPQREKELAELMKSGKLSDREKEKIHTEILEGNLRFVITVAKQYQNQGLPLSDLIAEGNLGLIKAAQRFDHTKGFRFISYAVWWVKQSIIQSLNDNARTVRLPVNITNNISKLKKEMAYFEQENCRKPEMGEMDLSILNQPHCMSLNETINEDGDEMLDIIQDNTFESPDESFQKESDLLKAELEKALSALSVREKNIIELYFGLNGTALTLEEIGDEYGLTKERIRQVKEKALRKLRAKSKNLFNLIQE